MLSINIKLLLTREFKARKLITTITKPWLLSHNYDNNWYANSTDKFLSYLIKLHIQDIQITQSKIKTTFIKLSNSYITEANTTITSLKNQKISWGVLYMYSVFFWAMNFNNSNAIFKKKIKSIDNSLNGVTSVKKQNHKAINRVFLANYPQLKKNNVFRFSQPAATYLLPRNTTKKLLQVSKNKNKLLAQRIMLSIFGGYIATLNKDKTAKSYKGLDLKNIKTHKTSKIAYAINQYTLNTFLRL